MLSLTRIKNVGKFLIILLLSVFFLTTVAIGRTPVPPPPGGGPGIAIHAPDLAFPYTPGSASVMDNQDWPSSFPLQEINSPRDDRAGMIGGDDIEVFSGPMIYNLDLVIASNGDQYCLILEGEEMSDYGFHLGRSQDGGTTWETWATFDNPELRIQYTSPSLHLAEGNENRIFVAYKYTDSLDFTSRIDVAWSPIADVASFTATTIHDQAGWCGNVSITSDATSFSQYYLYLAYGASEENPSEIRFTRSLDFGESWEESYAIGTLSLDDRDYNHPQVTYGYGGYVHVAWRFTIDSDEYTSGLRYRRVPLYGNGGLANWDPMRALSSVGNDVWERPADIIASLTGNQVLIACRRYVESVSQDFHVFVSEDQGDTFSGSIPVGEYVTYPGNVVQHPVTGSWMISCSRLNQAGYVWANETEPTVWNSHISFSDEYGNYSGGLALDPTRDNQVATCFVGYNYDEGDYFVKSDAAWRGEDGFPNHETGFPVDLIFTPTSDPAVVDLDGDGDLEIIFGDSAGRIQVFTKHGYPMTGWPVDVARPLSTSPIAIGDLNGNGEMTVLVGTEDGWVYGYNPDGSTAMGWPFDTLENEPASVIIGNLGPPYHRTAVVTCGTSMQFLNYQANNVVGTPIWNGAEDGFGPGPAIGDIDGDGVNEVVFTFVSETSSLVLAAEQTEEVTELYHMLSGTSISARPTLADFDLDGDVEIVVPTAEGLLFLLEGDGSLYPGAWPYNTGSVSPMSSAAIAACLGGSSPEIAVCSKNGSVDLIYSTGTSATGYPKATNGWYVYGSPVVGRVEGSSSDVVLGARGSKGWAWDNFGSLIEGWPKAFENHSELSPAMGDLDLDGRNEIVFLTRDQLVVVDVGTAPSGDQFTWPMAGHDPQRTGCSDCPEDMVTPVLDDDRDRVTRVSFAAPSPNPVSGHATFSFAVPVRAIVELSVFDLRGNRVALISREEIEAGQHFISWDGRDHQGRNLASGNYIAALRVRGPSLDQYLSRKVTVLR